MYANCRNNQFQTLKRIKLSFLNSKSNKNTVFCFVLFTIVASFCRKAIHAAVFMSFEGETYDKRDIMCVLLVPFGHVNTRLSK